MDWVGTRGARPDTGLERWLARQVNSRKNTLGMSTTELAARIGRDRTTVAAVLGMRKRGSMTLWTAMLESVGVDLS